MRILLIDDDRIDAMLFTRAITKILPHVVVEYKLSIPTFAECANYDGLIIDRMICTRDVIEVIRNLARACPQIPILMLTGFPPPEQQINPDNLLVADKNRTLDYLDKLRDFLGRIPLLGRAPK